MKEKKEFIVFSQLMAGYLMMRGFVLKRMMSSTKDNRKNVFVFKESDELMQAISEYEKPNNRKIKDSCK